MNTGAFSKEARAELLGRGHAERFAAGDLIASNRKVYETESQRLAGDAELSTVPGFVESVQRLGGMVKAAEQGNFDPLIDSYLEESQSVLELSDLSPKFADRAQEISQRYIDMAACLNQEKVKRSSKSV